MENINGESFLNCIQGRQLIQVWSGEVLLFNLTQRLRLREASLPLNVKVGKPEIFDLCVIGGLSW